MSHYQSVDEINGQFVNSPQGVTTNSVFFNFKPSTGGNYGVTNTYKLF
ncbi:hypothetical protein LPB87_19835 [Flavobacterium sp. EDS]|nr:hypothetical protein [Flavobacterium sp. EDS]MCD0476651.1 hypothetical protein [Flavobacterium sp. EDS]